MKKLNKVNEVLKLIDEDYMAFVLAMIIYEKGVSYDEALIMYHDFMNDDTKTSLLNIEEEIE